MSGFILCAVLLGAPATPEEVSEDPRAQAEDLYTRGRAKFETFDYDGAIELWTEAFGALPYMAEYAEIRAALVFNISAAQIEAYKLEPEPVRLERAKRLLHRYLETIDELYEGDSATEERARASARLDEIEALMTESSDDPPKTTTEPRATSGSDTDADRPKPGRPLIIAGAAVTAVGVGLLGGMGAGLAIGSSAESELPDLDRLEDEDDRVGALQRGKNGNTIAIALGVSGGVAVAAGVAVLAVGLSKRKKAGRSNSAPTIGAWMQPRSAGIVLSGRF